MIEDRSIEREYTYSRRLHQKDIPARPERKRRTFRKAPRILPLWARLTLLGMAIVVLALAAIGLVAKAIKPYREARQQSQQLLDTQRQEEALQAKNKNLRMRIAYLNTTSGTVLEARKIGFMKPGEIPFVVETDGLAAPASLPRLEPRHAVTVRSPLRHFWHRLTGR